MYEHYKEPVASRRVFLRRLVIHATVAVGIIAGSLAIGVLGYRTFEGFSWVDSLLNASMILGGMGPVNELHTTAGKLFASFYAIYSGVVFLVVAGVLFAPVIHRFMHHFHLQADDSNKAGRHYMEEENSRDSQYRENIQ